MPRTLLLADDSVTIQKVVGISFASEDIAITTVDNGNAAVAKARELRPDVILADVVMPGLSGYEVCEAVKADPALQHIPVLLLTGTFEAFDEQRAAAAGAAGHVAKPFEAQTLVDRVRQLLAAAPAPRPAPVAPVSATREPAAAQASDAFDFFADDESAASSADAFSDAPLDLDGPDAAFAFGDEDLSDAAQEPLAATPLARAPAPDATVAILPDPPAPAASEDAFDFSFDDVPAAPPARGRRDPLGHTALLDPAAGSDLDVSSSDLDVDLSSGPAAATEVVLSPDDDDVADADLDLTEPEPFADPVLRASADPVFEALSASSARERTPRPFGAEPDPGDTLPRRETPPPTPAFRSVAAGLDEEPGLAEPLEDDAIDAAPYAAEPIDDEADALPADLLDAEYEPLELAPPYADREPVAHPAPASPAGMAADALTPAMREELRDTLEKIAWDAFGQVTEKVVREAIERIERAAWEVVPKLAETLIQEEIRRLKGGE